MCLNISTLSGSSKSVHEARGFYTSYNYLAQYLYSYHRSATGGGKWYHECDAPRLFSLSSDASNVTMQVNVNIYVTPTDTNYGDFRITLYTNYGDFRITLYTNYGDFRITLYAT
jgi:hypothetical protein